MKTDAVINAIANLYSSQLLDAISATSGKDRHFYVEISGESCRMDVNNVQEMREILDETLLEPLLERSRESVTQFLADCVGRDEPTEFGYEVWFSVLKDIGATMSAAGGFDE